MMKEVRQIAAVVVTYKRDELLAQCLRCLCLQTAASKMDIIVVDNGGAGRSSLSQIPEVGNIDEIRNFQDKGGKLIYRNTGENLGGAGGFSLAMEEAVSREYQLVWVMDDDTQPEPEALEALLAVHEDKKGKYGFLSSQALWRDGTLNRMNIQRRSLTMKVRDFQSPAVPVVMASFVSLLVPSSVIKNMGLPIREFGTWTDDWEFTRRISRVYPAWLVNGSRVIHMTGENRGANIAADRDRPVSRYETMYRNDVYLYRREGLNGLIYETRRLMGHWFRIVFTTPEKRKRLGAMFRGTRAGMNFRPDIRYPEASLQEGCFAEMPGGRAAVPESVQGGDHHNTTKKKILQVFGEPISFGGEEVFVSEVLKAMDTRDLQVDLFTPYYCDNPRIVAEMESLGHRVFTRGCPFRPGGTRRQETRVMRDFLRASRWDVIHIHSGSVTMLRKYCKLARRSGIREIVVHAHCAGIPNISHTMTALFSRRVLTEYPSRWLACSEAAGQWMFPAKICRERLQVVKNGVDISRFAFDPAKRKRIRRELGIPESGRVIGFVGRLTEQKNPGFLISIAKNIRRSWPGNDIRLLLVGEGDQRMELEKQISGSSIDGLVIFTGNVENPEDFYQAMDVFALPSLFEGFSIAALEAQANGLTVVASTGVVMESQVAENFRRISLENKGAWEKALIEMDTGRTDNTEKIESRGLDIRETANLVRSIY